jgi:hypothetical protein
MALSQGWGVKEFASRAGIGTQAAGDLLREAVKRAEIAIDEIVTVDALSLSVPVNGEQVTLGRLQGELVTGAVTALAQTPPNPRDWTRKDQDGYNNSMRVLKDAKALGLIRFGEADKTGGNTPALRHIDPFTARSEGRKQGKGEKPLEESSTVNDGASRCDGEGDDNPPAQGEGEE